MVNVVKECLDVNVNDIREAKKKVKPSVDC
jgi:hypothetical protein